MRQNQGNDLEEMKTVSSEFITTFIEASIRSHGSSGIDTGALSQVKSGSLRK